MLRTLLCIAMAAPLMVQAAQAQRVPVRTGVAAPFSECYCRARGQRFEVGQSVCLRGPAGPRLASCQMEQNVTSWRLSETPCPDS